MTMDNNDDKNIEFSDSVCTCKECDHLRQKIKNYDLFRNN